MLDVDAIHCEPEFLQLLRHQFHIQRFFQPVEFIDVLGRSVEIIPDVFLFDLISVDKVTISLSQRIICQ
jgi:hypothetical protein